MYPNTTVIDIDMFLRSVRILYLIPAALSTSFRLISSPDNENSRDYLGTVNNTALPILNLALNKMKVYQ